MAICLILKGPKTVRRSEVLLDKMIEFRLSIRTKKFNDFMNSILDTETMPLTDNERPKVKEVDVYRRITFAYNKGVKHTTEAYVLKLNREDREKYEPVIYSAVNSKTFLIKFI